MQLLSVEDKLQCTLTEGWEMCLGFQKLSDVLAVLHELQGCLVALVELLAHGPSSAFSALRALGATLSWLGARTKLVCLDTCYRTSFQDLGLPYPKH